MGPILIALVVVVLALSARADPIGVGEGSGVGWTQIAGMVAGVAAVAIGALWRRSGPSPGSASVDV